MTIITDIDLDPNDVLKAIHHAQLIAQRNRCKSWDKRIIIVSGNPNDLRTYGNERIADPNDIMLGVCWNGHETERYIYIRPGRPDDETIITLCHELAHAFTNPNAKHSYSWRSLNLLYYATLPRIFGYDFNRIGSAFIDEVTHIRNRYEPRGYTPIHRHLNAMNRMLEWYVKTVEKDMAS